MKTGKTTPRRASGRPRKFIDSSRPVTVTLPERTLKQLESIDKDRARAMVKCVDAVAGTGRGFPKPVEFIEVAPGKAIIIVGPSKALKSIPWLRMIEIAPARYLLSLPAGKATESLEVTLRDLMENLTGESHSQERSLLEELCGHIGRHRRSETVTRGELLFVDV